MSVLVHLVALEDMLGTDYRAKAVRYRLCHCSNPITTLADRAEGAFRSPS